MAASTEQQDVMLLFYDTFIHDASEELRVDMVKFPLPVTISEVRIVPVNYSPHGKLASIDKLGKTTPNNFKLDVYINDSSNPLAPTFQSIGAIDFKDDCLSLVVTSKVSCDVVVIRGYYMMVSLCLYGMTSGHQPFTVPVGYTQDTGSYGEKQVDDRLRKRLHSPEGDGSDAGRGSPPRLKTQDSSKEWSSLLDFFEPFSPDHSPEHSFDLYDDDIPPAKRGATTDAGFEEFSDEEIAFAEDDIDIQETEFEPYSEDSWLNTNISFNPYQATVIPLESFSSLFDTPHEILLSKKFKQEKSSMKRSHSDEATRIKEQVSKLKEMEINYKWIETIEELIPQLYPGLAQLELRFDDNLESFKCICEWVFSCLKDEHICSLPPPVNVRLLKTGLRLGTAVSALGTDANSNLIEQGVLERLCEIVSVDFIPSSIKLMCIGLMSLLMDYPVGMERFLGWSQESHDGHVMLQDETLTCYRQMLEIILSNQTCRVQSAVSILLRKAHLYELLTSLHQLINQVVSATPTITRGGATKGEGEEQPNDDDDDEVHLINQEECKMEGIEEEKGQPLSNELVKKITQMLEELHKMLKGVESNLGLLPPKAFPNKNSSTEMSPEEIFVGVGRMLKHTRMLEGLLILLTSPLTIDEMSIFGGVRNLLLLLLQTQYGLLFLSTRPPLTNMIIKVLINSMENEVPLDALQPLTDFDESSDTCSAFNLGMLLIHHLQVLQSIDVLKSSPKQTMRDLESESLPSLHTLFSMTLIPIGKCAVSHVLTLDNNITVLLPFMEPRGSKDHDIKLSRSSISSRYAAALIIKILQSSSNLSHDFLSSHSRRFLAMSEFFSDNQSLTMSALHRWLHPLKNVSSDEVSTITSLMSVVKENIPHIHCNKPSQGSAAIITSLRLILLKCSSQSALTNDVSYTLKQREALVALFSAGAIEILTDLIQRLSELLLPLWSHRQSIGTNNAIVLDILVSLSLRLLRLALVQLLSDGSFQCRNTSVLHSLFSLHMVVCSAPHSRIFQSSALETQNLIVDCLVTFTRPEDASGTDSAPLGPSNSSWCLLISELITHTKSKPQAFLSGLMLLSVLLPLPLPFRSPKAPPVNVIQDIVSLRHLWTIHLLPLSSAFSSLIETLVPSMCMALQHTLRRCLAQLVDLAPSLAMSIAKIICSHILIKIDSQDDESSVKDTDLLTNIDKRDTTSPLVMVLTLCAVLASQPMFKCALLSLILPHPKGEEGEDSYDRFIPLLLFLVQKKETVIPAKLCVMTILQSLMNVCITLSDIDKDVSITLQQLSDSLPSQFEHILSAVINHVGSSDQPLSTIALGLKIISSSCQHILGLTLLQTLLPSSIKRFVMLLKRLISTIKESAPPPPEALQCSSLLLDTLGDFVAPDSALSLSIPLSIVKSAIMDENKEDLLLHLQRAIHDNCKGEDDEQQLTLIEEFSVSILELSEVLKEVEPNIQSLAPPTLELPPMQSLERQFLSRANLVVTDSHMSSSPEYWLASPPYDEDEVDPETMTVNLEEICKEVCGDFNLSEELKKQFLPSPPSSPVKHESRKKKIVISGPEAQKRLKEAMHQRRIMGRGKDLFRTRKQNTSRPPSMHVDDFMNIDSRLPGGLQRGPVMRGGGVMRGREGFGLSSPYIMNPSTLLPPHMRGQWMGGLTHGLGAAAYSRRDLPVHHSWESRTQQFLASVNKPEPMRSVWSHVMQQDPYNRVRNAASARMVQMMNYGRSTSHGNGNSSKVSSRLSSRRN